jgi:drug/metabolite transporter (DMT)-like permease
MTALTTSLDHMDATKRAYLELHIAVFLWGFTAILGDLIQLSAIMLVWWRVLITSISLLFFIRGGKALFKLPRKTILQFAFVGALTGLHWLTFFGAIKLSNASITLVCMATTAFFTSILEPLILKTKFKYWEIFLGFLVVPGMALVVESVDSDMHIGIWVGLTSAFLAALFGTLNKKWINNAEPFSITYIEMTSAWLVLCLLIPFYVDISDFGNLIPSLSDFGLLLVLALGCTTFTWVLALRSLKYLTAFASSLTVNLEPVYGIFLAWIILEEYKELSPGFYIGVLLILAVVFSYPFLNEKMKKEKLPL